MNLTIDSTATDYLINQAKQDGQNYREAMKAYDIDKAKELNQQHTGATLALARLGLNALVEQLQDAWNDGAKWQDPA